MALSLVSYGDSGSDSEVEDETVKDQGSSNGKAQQDMRKLLSVLPPPKNKSGPMKQKHPVRIGLPTLNKGNDSDSDDDLPVAKKPKQSGGGLTALLPEPKGAARQFGSGKKTSSSLKTMVPYTLTKRYQDSKKQTKTSLKKSKAGPSTKHGEEDNDSDNDEPVSFFSLDETSKTDTIIPNSDLTEQSIPEPDTVTGTSIPNSTSDPPDQSNSNSPHTTHQPTDYYSNIAATQYQGWENTNEQYAYVQGPSLQGYTSQYPEVTQDYAGVQEPSVDTSQSVSAAGPGLSIDEEQLRRLAGGKRGRKRDEGLNNILDIKEDDVKEGIRDYQKYHSEDSVNKLYQMDNCKVNTPTGQQKRKHQLSYLAHQAKANELELSKHWAQSAATRRDTQMKYGF